MNQQALAFGYFPVELILHFAEILSTAPTSTIETLFVSNIDNHQVTIGQQEMSNIWNEDQLMNNGVKVNLEVQFNFQLAAPLQDKQGSWIQDYC